MEKYTSPGLFSIESESPEKEMERLTKWINSLDGHPVDSGFIMEVDRVKERIYFLSKEYKIPYEIMSYCFDVQITPASFKEVII